MWKRIETAPKEIGAEYLVYIPGDNRRYHVCLNMSNFRIIGGVFDFDRNNQPTMWMEIPIPPSSAIEWLQQPIKEIGA